MSFILDALRKSESERQKNSAPGIAAARYRAGPSRRGPWLPIIGIVLFLNALLLLGLLWRARSDGPAVQTVNTQLPSVAPTPPPMPRSARPPPAVRPLAREVAGPAATAPVSASGRSSVPAGAAPPQPQDSAPSPSRIEAPDLPSMQTLILRGELELPPLRLDMHVYSETVGQRFILINMNKYREGDQMKEGPRVESIDPIGVVLVYQGKKFTLERE